MKYEDRLRSGIAQARAYWHGRLPSDHAPVLLGQIEAQYLANLVAAVRDRQEFDASVVVEGPRAAEYLRLDLAVTNRLAALDKEAAK